MTTTRPLLSLIPVFLIVFAAINNCAAEADAPVPLPDGVKAVWDLEKASREKSPTRERVCLNGLWRWQPAHNAKGPASLDNPVSADTPLPGNKWGYFKVPGCWPGITDYMQKDSQTLFAHPGWKDENLRSLTAAWCQREITIPQEWAGRRIAIYTEYLNSVAILYIDGQKAGKMQFPGGELDISSLCHAGNKHVLTMLVIAAPLNEITLLFSDTNTNPLTAKRSNAHVERRGLCGDVFLIGTPAGARLIDGDVKIGTSVRKGEITLDIALQDLNADAQYTLHAQILDNEKVVKEFTSKQFKNSDLKNGRIAVAENWKAEKLWDIHTPQNMYQLELSLLDAGGKALDTALPVRFGYREFWIDGRDFYLNGTRIFLSCVPVDNAAVGSALCTYAAAKETLERLKSFGINFVYTHNFGCDPGDHLSFSEILRAADDVGMLVALTQPHFGQYDWKAGDADLNNGYARHAEFYVRMAGSHPAIVFYAMSHNATGYNEDMNPDKIDGLYERRQSWAVAGANKALRAEAIVRRLDPNRIVYHHSSGNLGSMHTMNFYPNFTPVQELSDWFEHWATQGVKPAFTCEYGAPFSWDWTMYRGWYWDEKGKWTRNFGSAKAPWEFCMAEWNSQFIGDRAFQISEMEKANLRFEGQQLKAGKTWFRWDYPFEVGSTKLSERYPIMAMYYSGNFRAYRTWGVSAISPWEHGMLWKTRDGLDRNRKTALKVDWENLQRPGYSPDYLEERYENFDTAYERADWVATPAAQALLRNNMPLLAYIGGSPEHFTGNEHNFKAGETVEKQLIIINNSRETVSCECEWSCGFPQAVHGAKKVSVKTGEQERIPLRVDVPAGLAPGAYELSASVRFSSGETQKDSITLHVLPPAQLPKTDVKIAIFDPKGETTQLLGAIGVKCQSVDAGADLAAFDTLIVGKAALTEDGPAPDITRVREGLKVILFEQTTAVLEKRFGFRVAEYGLRNVYKRVPDHPLLAGLDNENLRDWRGEATLLPSRLKVQYDDNHFNGAPTVKWCDIEVTRIWRCGCRGNVASALIEKPACGNFIPILDGGFSLQYSPLLEYREGKGLIIFCQMDVTGRTASDPAAAMLTRNILDYATTWKPAPLRKALYAGDEAGMNHLKKTGLSVDSYAEGVLSDNQVLIVGPGGGEKLAGSAAAVGNWLKAGGHLLALGLDEKESNAFLPFKVSIKKAEYISSYFEPPGMNSPLEGIGPADVHNRDPRQLPLLSAGATVLGNGVLGKAEDASVNVLFCQLVPWQFGYKAPQNTKRTFRRVSFLLSRLLGNWGVASATPLLDRFHSPVDVAKQEKRWLNGFYLDQPEEWDDPYRFFRW